MWFYGDIEEELSLDTTKPRGKGAKVTIWVDADNVVEILTRFSNTGVILFVNSAPIVWNSKHQTTID